MRSRGQNALEYMMTYGWAILVVLVVGVLVWQMGILDLSRNISPDKRGFSQVTPLDWSLSQGPAADLVIVVQNNAGTILTLNTVVATIETGGSGVCSLDTLVPITNFRPGSTLKLDFSNCPVDASSGDYYRVDVTLDYLNPGSGLTHTSTGVIWGPVS